MNRHFIRLLATVPVIALALAGVVRDTPTIAGPVADKRLPWITSKVTGSPEPPHPYKVVRVFPKFQFKKPLHAAAS